MSEDASKRSPEQIEADLARTRAELSSTVNELTEMLDPRRQVEEAKVNLRAAADRATENAKAKAKEKVDGVAVKAREFADDVRSGDPKSVGYLGAGVAVVASIITLMARRGR
ncbi:DUF3618 domain-containing protein [Georgenia faecalis]|uniref:DUF3618 domain-containing protein n=1 Tax=Georgenia faecalis TaxID=2483799 RepID=A0ABV9DC34_9MICO|nr:DUF3618 domain-containing protein [Georgenia faecalis]